MAWHATWNEPPGRQRGFFTDRGGLFPPGVKLILILTVAVFLLEIRYAGPLMAWGAVTVRGLQRLEGWRLVTYMFLHVSTDHILLNMFFLWMLGMVFERQVGTRRFLALYFAAGVAGGLCEVAFNLTMYRLYGHPEFLDVPSAGASAGVMGVLVAFATLNPRARFYILFLLPMEAWLFALIYALYETWPIATAILRGPVVLHHDNTAHAAHFGGMVLGFVWMKWGGRLAEWWRRGAPPAPERFVRRDEAEERAELDRILDKIRQEGLDRLTLRERMFLQEMSRKYRDRF